MALRKMTNPLLDLSKSGSQNDNNSQDLENGSHASHKQEFIKRIEQQELDKINSAMDNKPEADTENNGKALSEKDAVGKKEKLDIADKTIEDSQGGVNKMNDLAVKNYAEVVKQAKEKNSVREPVPMTSPENIARPKLFESDNKESLLDDLPIREQRTFEFPADFLWGTSTSAYQIEGGIINDWSQWEKDGRRMLKLMKAGKNPDDFISAQACDSFNRYEEDFDLAKSLNTNAIRFSIEWSRVQPEREFWDVEAINHYRRMIAAAKKRGFKTAITLWHWTLPTWVAADKGWENKGTIEAYLEYVKMIILEMGGDIDYWVTLNEPMIHILNGYIRGKFPPNRKNIFIAGRVADNLAQAHQKAYALIHDHFPDGQVGLTNIINDIEAARKWFLPEQAIAGFLRWYFNSRFLKKIIKYSDYIGLDYYFHDRIVWYPPFVKNKNKQINDMGWEIYPKGIYNTLQYLKSFHKPILILENGIADKDDKYRADFIKAHLFWVHKAISEGADVRGYFHWSLIDNFEWADGYLPKFGLFAVDRKTFVRTPRPSAKIYAEICRKNLLEL